MKKRDMEVKEQWNRRRHRMERNFPMAALLFQQQQEHQPINAMVHEEIVFTDGNIPFDEPILYEPHHTPNETPIVASFLSPTEGTNPPTGLDVVLNSTETSKSDDNANEGGEMVNNGFFV